MSIRFVENASTAKKTMMWIVVATLISGCSECGKESAGDPNDPSASSSSANMGDNPAQGVNPHFGPTRVLPPNMRPAMRMGVTPADAGH